MTRKEMRAAAYEKLMEAMKLLASAGLPLWPKRFLISQLTPSAPRTQDQGSLLKRVLPWMVMA
jgi:hypothetical protein